MLADVFVFLIKCIGVSSALWILYLCLFSDKAKYLSQRIFLLLLSPIALIASLLSFDVIKLSNNKLVDDISNLAHSVQIVVPKESAMTIPPQEACE